MVIGVPPVVVGATIVNKKPALNAVIFAIFGAVDGPTGIAVIEGADGEFPVALVAKTVMTYEVPLISFVNVQDFAVVVVHEVETLLKPTV